MMHPFVRIILSPSKHAILNGQNYHICKYDQIESPQYSIYRSQAFLPAWSEGEGRGESNTSEKTPAFLGL